MLRLRNTTAHVPVQRPRTTGAGIFSTITVRHCLTVFSTISAVKVSPLRNRNSGVIQQEWPVSKPQTILVFLIRLLFRQMDIELREREVDSGFRQFFVDALVYVVEHIPIFRCWYPCADYYVNAAARQCSERDERRAVCFRSWQIVVASSLLRACRCAVSFFL